MSNTKNYKYYKSRVNKDIEQLKVFNDDKTSLITIDKIFEEINTIVVKFQSTTEKCYTLMIKIDKNYPFKEPTLKFLNDIPDDKHVDADGNLNFQNGAWTPAITLVGLIYNIMSHIS
jgi:ubiquitin-protein ligase